MQELPLMLQVFAYSGVLFFFVPAISLLYSPRVQLMAMYAGFAYFIGLFTLDVSAPFVGQESVFSPARSLVLIGLLSLVLLMCLVFKDALLMKDNATSQTSESEPVSTR